ncbi:MAG: hypothetical protein IJC50_02430 [Clostridia bacterium]|nr:hypothetical protein [Clostridia bacterium]
MNNNYKNKTKWIWLSALILFISVAATTIVFTSRVYAFLLDDEGAIPLIADEPSVPLADSTQTDESAEPESSADTEIIPDAVDSETNAATEQSYTGSVRPGFEASDDQTVWTTDTQVEIFRISYENGEKVVTVHSNDGDKLIAPGTENSYTFKLKNTGNVALDYTVEVDAYFTPADIEIPVVTRLNRYDGEWIVGAREEYADISALDKAEDKAILGAGKYTYYTLDWMWPFESGNDEYDTMLGNLAVDEDLTFTIVIKTTAEANVDPTRDDGITPPQTGDNTQLALWVVIAASSFIVFIILIVIQKKEKRRAKAQA